MDAMDVGTVAAQAVTTLTPVLPLLVKAGEGAADEAGRGLARGAGAAAGSVWRVLRPHLAARAAARSAVADAAARPQDPDARAALRLQVRKLLEEDPALAARLAGALRAPGVAVRGRGNRVAVAGDGSVVAGRISRSAIRIGDEYHRYRVAGPDDAPAGGAARLVYGLGMLLGCVGFALFAFGVYAFVQAMSSGPWPPLPPGPGFPFPPAVPAGFAVAFGGAALMGLGRLLDRGQ
jgi:hypothetical protein